MNVEVGEKVATTSSLMLTGFEIRYKSYVDMPRLLAALEDGEVEAIVADDVVLKYMIDHGRTNGRFENS
ncbi:transporter substrate-binding domain-containing protein [Vibrio cyclitrophicus]